MNWISALQIIFLQKNKKKKSNKPSFRVVVSNLVPQHIGTLQTSPDDQNNILIILDFSSSHHFQQMEDS